MSRLISPTITRTLLALAVAAVGATASAKVARAATDGPYQDVYYVNGCASSTADIFSPSYYGNMAANNNCPSELDIDAPNPGAGDGNRAEWSAITPSAAIGIIGVTSTGVADCNLHSDGFQADYFYGAGDTNYGVPSITVDCHGATNQNGVAGDLNQHIQSSQYFGWQASCTKSTCTPTGAGIIVFSVTGITLEAQETSGPALTADASNNLYHQSAWVRGTFPADLSASDPSGVCSMQTTVNGRAINSYSDPSPDTSQWSQCPGSAIDASVDTTTYSNGADAITLAYSASNAAGAVSSVSKAINVDNVTPSVSLSAPADTDSTSGTEDVTATGSAGPSGVAAIYCSVDGAPVQTYSGASAQIPVSGIGSHEVACYDRNRAVDSSGATAISPTQTLGLSIRQPTAAGITFADRRRAALPPDDRNRDRRRSAAPGAAARQDAAGARPAAEGAPAREALPRAHGPAHGIGGAQAPRPSGAARRQARPGQATRAAGGAPAHRREADAANLTRQEHHCERIRGVGRRHCAGWPVCAGPVSAR